MTKTENKGHVTCRVVGMDGKVSGVRVGEIRKGIVSGMRVQQIRNQISSPKKPK